MRNRIAAAWRSLTRLDGAEKGMAGEVSLGDARQSVAWRAEQG